MSSIINQYLSEIAGSAVLSTAERSAIETSIATLDKRLFETFDDSVVKSRILFGSYARATMLPRWMDQNSDVDYMVVFAGEDLTPQTYLNRLRRFVDNRYPSSEIYQDHPTLSLELNHIRFELVPAQDSGFWAGLQIPSKGTFSPWMSTVPDEINEELANRDVALDGLLLPLIRLAKYWNAKNSYLFESYALERQILRHGFWLVPQTLEAYFFHFMDSLDVSWLEPAWKGERIALLRKRLAALRQDKALGNWRAVAKTLGDMLPPKNKLTLYV